MRHARSSMVLLALSVVAIVAAWLGVSTQRLDYPTGSSYSRQADGAEALYVWAEGEGVQLRRITAARTAADSPPRVLLVLQPEEVISDGDRRAFDAVARSGGTLVLAGDFGSAGRKFLQRLFLAVGLEVGDDAIGAQELKDFHGERCLRGVCH